MPAADRYEDCVPGLAFDQGGYRGPVRSACDQVSFPMPDLGPRFDDGRSVVDGLHVGRLLERPVAGAATPALVAIGPSRPQRLQVGGDYQATIGRLVDRLVAQVPPFPLGPPTPQHRLIWAGDQCLSSLQAIAARSRSSASTVRGRVRRRRW